MQRPQSANVVATTLINVCLKVLSLPHSTSTTMYVHDLRMDSTAPHKDCQFNEIGVSIESPLKTERNYFHGSALYVHPVLMLDQSC